MLSIAGIAMTNLERGTLVPPGLLLLLLLLLLTPPLVMYLNARFRSWHELRAWGLHAVKWTGLHHGHGTSGQNRHAV